MTAPQGRGDGADGAGAVAAVAAASVVIATIGRAESVRHVVEAVLDDPGTSEVVVVVDGPDPATVDVLRALEVRYPRLVVVPLTHRGHLGALDEGVRRATSDVVVLLDDDVVPAQGTITGHLAHHQGAARLVVVGPIPIPANDVGPGSVATRLYAAEYRSHLEALARSDVDVLDVLWGGNVSLRRSDCLEVGLASPAFRATYHEDRDLGYRLRAAGLVGRFDPALVAAHLHRRTDAQFLRDAERQGEGRVALHAAHPERHGPFRYAELVDDLPAPVAAVVAVAGASGAGPRAARWLMAGGRLLARVAPKSDGAVVCARLARRIMQWHGARRACRARRAAGNR